jgi:8-oxo-dGTP pyrophosphatase MutT (NUDIX family)/nitroimidazol reductase NimA-like FMN-containing flavoprotein (pyridoxamine 5'-phosphate oxidase superfamily)
MSGELGPGPRTRVRRLPARALYDEASVFSVFDAANFTHVSAIVDGRAMSLPTLHVREGRTLYFHASVSNALWRAALRSGEASCSAAIYDGLRLARSGFESSVAYRSVVAFGPVREVTDDEAGRVLDRFVEATLPGRGAELRAMTPRERRLTLVVAMEIAEASAKWSAGPTSDDAADADLDVWSGVLPARLVYGAPIPSFDGAMAAGTIAVPASVLARRRDPTASAAARLREQLGAVRPVDHRERAALAALADRLEWGTDLFDEWADPRHVTASAFVVSSRGVILHRHRRLGIWVQPGGHVDAGESPEAAAGREVREETGLVTSPFRDGGLFHVDVHAGPRGHTHYDLRFVLLSDGSDPAPGPGESPEVAWFPLAEAPALAEPALRGALAKLSTLLEGAKGETLGA